MKASVKGKKIIINGIKKGTAKLTVKCRKKCINIKVKVIKSQDVKNIQ